MRENLGQPIYNLQIMLRLISQSDSRILPVIPDGIYGPNTYAAVRSYQEIAGLSATGSVDQDTWDRIVSQYNAIIWNIAPSDGLYLVQAMLAAVSEQYSSINAPPITGKNNTQTEAALISIQNASNLTPSGIPTPETRKALMSLYNSIE